MIVVDTLRADRLAAYVGPGADDGRRETTPFLDALARRATVYRRAVAPSSWTVPSIASLLTSRHASQHTAVGFDSRLPASEVTFVERLAEAGWATGGISANPRLEARFGYAQGFDHWEVLKDPRRLRSLAHRKVRGERVRGRALAWLDVVRAEPDVPWFLYVHFMEPHSPYVPPEALRRRFAGDVDDAEVERVNRKLLDLEDLYGEALTQDELRLLVDLYDAEVAAADAELAALFEALEARGVLDEAWVVVTSDHGEDFREHGRVLHGFTLYEPSIRVPLIVLAPGEDAAVSNAPASLIDLGPTVLALAGLDPEPRFEGVALRSDAPPRDQLSELLEDRPSHGARVHSAALLRGDDKLLLRHEGGREFYDLARDRDERSPEPAGASARADALEAALRDRLEALRADVARPQAEALDEETAAALRALGYAAEPSENEGDDP